MPADSGNPVLGAVLIVAMLVGGLLTYVFPTYIAARRNHPNLTAIAVLNIALGWTLVFWVAALVWAVVALPESEPAEVPNTRCRACGKLGIPTGAKACSYCNEPA